MSGFVGLIIGVLIIVLAVIVVARTIRVIQQGSVGVVKRLGQFHSVRNPGVTFLLPFVDTMELVDMRETPRTGDRQDVISKDNVSLQVNATIFSQVVDPQAALFGVSNYHVAVDNLARASLRAVLGEMTLDEALSQREAINAKLQARMESEADGRAAAIAAVYGAINAGHPNPELLAVLQLDTLQKFAASPNSKVLVPYESAGLLGAAQALRSVLDGVPEANQKAPLGPDRAS